MGLPNISATRPRLVENLSKISVNTVFSVLRSQPILLASPRLNNDAMKNVESVILEIMQKVFPLAVSLLIAGILFMVFQRLPQFSLLPCTRPLFQSIVLALASTVVITSLLALRWRHHFRLSLVVLSALCIVAFFLGSYRYSPLDFSEGDDPILHGFLITRQGRVNDVVASGDVVLLSAAMPAAISIRSELRDMSCRWMSSNGGAWDDPFSCDTIYLAPSTDFDILTVMIEPGCNLPPVRGQIKISILP